MSNTTLHLLELCPGLREAHKRGEGISLGKHTHSLQTIRTDNRIWFTGPTGD